MAEEIIGGVQPVLDALVERLGTELAVELELIEGKIGRPTPAPTDPEEPDLWRIPKVDPDPELSVGLFASNDRSIIQPEEYPAVLVVAQNSLPSRIEDMVEGRPTRVVPYVVRIWVLCRHWTYDDVSAARNRLAVGVEQALLRSAVLGAGMRILLDGWTTSYSEVDVADEDQRSYAGWWLQLVVESVEHLGDVLLAGGPGIPLEIELAVHPEAD